MKKKAAATGQTRGTTAKHAGTPKHVHGKGKHHPKKRPAAASLHHARGGK